MVNRLACPFIVGLRKKAVSLYVGSLFPVTSSTKMAWHFLIMKVIVESLWLR